MKKYIKNLLILSLFTAIIIGCTENDNEENVYTGDNFISFGAVSTASALESATGTITITAYASIPNLQNDVTVGFEITTDNATAADYTIIDGKSSFSFGSGKYEDSIQIKPIDNLVEDGEKVISITLSNTSDSSLIGFPGPDGKGKTFTVVFKDDDCAFTLQGLGDATWSGSDNAPAGQAGPNDSQVTTSFDGTNLLIEGLAYGWLTDTAYWDEVIVDSFPVIAIVEPITGEISIALQPLCTTTWLGDPQPPYSIEGTGQFVSCTGTMTISYNLIQGGSTLRSFTEILTIN